MVDMLRQGIPLEAVTQPILITDFSRELPDAAWQRKHFPGFFDLRSGRQGHEVHLSQWDDELATTCIMFYLVYTCRHWNEGKTPLSNRS